MYARRRVTVALVAVALVAGLVWLFSGGGNGSKVSTAATPHATTPQSPTTAGALGASPTPSPTATVAPTTTSTTTDVGLLAQTQVQPPSDDASLTQRLAPLWSAIQTNSLSAGLPLFFPESAYVKMKTGRIPNPSGDYRSRLVGFYALDLAAYNRAIGTPSSAARYLDVYGDSSLASWIDPGSCENSIGYWHLPNARIVYRNATGVQSFAVASLISWRGQWYVVHLGPNPRPSDVGTVALPSGGPGTPGPGGGC